MITVPIRMILVAVGLLALLTYLLAGGATPDTGLHGRRLDALRRLTLAEADLHRDTLKAHAGILRSYDSIVASVEAMRAAAAELRPLAATSAEIEPLTLILPPAVDEREQLVEKFKSDNALLWNSISYFATTSFALSRPERPTAALVGRAATAILRFVKEPSPEVGGDAAEALTRLEDAAARDPTKALDSLIVHGRLILMLQPTVEAILARILEPRIAEITRQIQALLIAQFTEEERAARYFRFLLYLSAVLLLVDLCRLYLRLSKSSDLLARQAAALRARSAFERLVAEISTQFIDLSPDRLTPAIETALGHLGRHLDLDRACLALAEQPSVAWARPGIAAAPRPATLSALARHLGQGEGCIVLTAGATPSRQATGTWVGLAVGQSGDRPGLLALEAPEPRAWPDDDLQLLRMVAEVLTNALERAAGERQRAALERRLRRAERMEALGTLAGGIAHNFNNVLGAILGYAEMASAALPRRAPARRHLEEVGRAGLRARAIVDQVLTFSRTSERAPRPLHLAPIVDEAVRLLRASLPAATTIEVRRAAEDAVVAVDPAQLLQVVMNLVTNAAQAMGGVGTVAVALDEIEVAQETPLSHGELASGRYARLTVRDAGRGIAPEFLGRVFEPFFTTKDLKGGTGLGLSTVHGIVIESGGALDVWSRPNAGSRFRVFLPLSPAAPEDREPAPKSPRGAGQTILVLDDEQPQVLLLEEMLAALGYEPVGFTDAQSALEAVRTSPDRFDLALLDEVMPVMSGSRLAAAFAAVAPDLPLVLMTGRVIGADEPAVVAGPWSAFLHKPLTAGDLARCLARRLRSPTPAAASEAAPG